MQKTPQRIGSKVSETIDRLNTHWDLGLPRLHGAEAVEAQSKGHLARKCSSKIRFLCFKTDEIEQILQSFEESARQTQSRWVWKPSQVPGTLPALAVTKSQLAKDVQMKSAAGLIRLTERQREELLQVLHRILDEHYELARMSKSYSYERPTATSFAAVSPMRAVDEPQVKDPMSRSGKRSLSSPQGENKRQSTLSQFLKRGASPPPQVPIIPPDPPSFETMPSARVSSVFTTADEADDPLASNDTSMASSPADGSPNYFTQDTADLMNDETFEISFNEACATVPDLRDPFDLSHNSPFKRTALLPSTVPFWYCWEIHRVASMAGLVPIDVYKTVAKKVRKTNPTYDEMWNVLKDLCHDNGVKTIVKSEIPCWITNGNRYENPESNQVVYLTGKLDWDSSPQALFTFHPNETHLEKSCRLHRKFGADRFLVVSAPDFSRCPKQTRPPDSEKLHRRICEFLVAGPHIIAGREWKVFWVEQEKKRKKEEPRLKIHMFAENGYDMAEHGSEALQPPASDFKINGQHRAISLEQLMEWHMPILPNIKTTDLKLFSRWSIGLSKTTPAVVLEQNEFLYLRDAPGSVVMNDGCALMSYNLAKNIWQRCGGQGPPPSAVQGRISGAKGLWLVDYHDSFADVSQRGFWIQVSDSQLKIKPHPRDRSADESQRTFEVLKSAGECKEAHLNIQLITILEDRGVPRAALRKLLEDDTKSYFESLKEAMEDPKALRAWMQEHGLASRTEVTRFLGSFPLDRRDQMKYLLESGFDPTECARLKDLAAGFLQEYMTNYVERLWINVPCSTVVFCAPDPLGVLEEGQVFINFTSPVYDPVKGYHDTVLEGLDVLVARNPAYLASDMQLCQAVYKHELHLYKNVILFPVKGKQPLASLLSGGDYDGDTVTVIWDPDIVRNFSNTSPPKLPTEEQCGMVQMSRPLSSIYDGVQAFPMQDFLEHCVSFNARPGLMGVCSSEHEKLVYSLSLKRGCDILAHQGAIKLAALAGYLVDSSKQGWYLARKAFHAIRREASGPKELPVPAFKGDIAPLRMFGTYLNVIDFLKFEVAGTCREQALTVFGKLRYCVKYDSALSLSWKKEVAKATQETAIIKSAIPTRRSTSAGKSKKVGGLLKDATERPGEQGHSMLKDLLEGPDGLLGQIKEVKERANRLAVMRNLADSTPTNSVDRGKFYAEVLAIHERYQAIEPKDIDHPLRRQFEEEQNHPYSKWALLRASCLHYNVCSKGRFPVWVWYIAGRELCYLKTLSHQGEMRVMTMEMHSILKVDTKFTKSLLEGKSSEGDDVFYDALEQPSLHDDDSDYDDED
ncbi:hypothetical protein HRR83_005791 [Exophiala dermatitidis]|uniref:RNA-dependent RNA polymerase n=2 Tax=Exophiala dermatitidis TaxID=5970 RepID=H6BUY1_EXODN|nr:RNA-directed RNA polymerase [Exophiala dermatitidis NIH/UT8656]KAJ4508699.1 hypothetical protein HRR73_007366 [Exophiala dermatitidis]EHY54951.1 RNA-directed RNA polymerase [Exophiala dermatitidis NIH/UT8656]KAJ4510950.1 hypothetical protein HRR75_005644 [Exophiala dermatitidis]KAJ4513347.1 hypothetical protein HRR74_006159 [Exophiala dermatitidis]KAJ4538101.1 hypothetical protein HRR77_007141 [Exophiala dermatitidis]